MRGAAELSRAEARRFLLCHHGLLGRKAYKGKAGAEAFVRRVGCVQYDPVNVCGRNAELVMLSRVEGYKSRMLWELLYKDRVLCDYWDKCMCIIPTDEMRYFSRHRERYAANRRGREQIDAVIPKVVEMAGEREFVSSSDIGERQRVDWSWKSSTAANAALERLYYEGRLVIHHKEGAARYYTLPEKVGMDKYLNQPDPNPRDEDYFPWAMKRRINAAGMLADRASDVLLGIVGMRADGRRAAVKRLLEDGEILTVSVEGETYFVCAEDMALISEIKSGKHRAGERCELIAPLDNLMWDRRMIKSIFDFDYKWEIYTPKEQRRYGHYVLPVLYRDRLVGRIEPVADGRAGRLVVRNFWPEESFEMGDRFVAALKKAVGRLAAMNDCGEVEWQWKS